MGQNIGRRETRLVQHQQAAPLVYSDLHRCFRCTPTEVGVGVWVWGGPERRGCNFGSWKPSVRASLRVTEFPTIVHMSIYEGVPTFFGGFVRTAQ